VIEGRKMVESRILIINNTDDCMKNQKVIAMTQNIILSMNQGGVGLDSETKNRFNEVEFGLSEISVFISNDIIDPTTDFMLALKIVRIFSMLCRSESSQCRQAILLLLLSHPQIMKLLWHILITAPLLEIYLGYLTFPTARLRNFNILL
jgi:hypothetical protein